MDSVKVSTHAGQLMQQRGFRKQDINLVLFRGYAG